MERWELKAGLEAILIAVDRPVTLQVLAQALDASSRISKTRCRSTRRISMPPTEGCRYGIALTVYGWK